MRQKLVYTQGILEGVTLERFELVLTNAAPLRNMDMTNAFVLLGHQEYLKRVTNFQASVDALTKAARQTNTTALAKAYTRMTDACFDCHRHFRREQFLRSGAP